jgi:hypothetical protein
MDQRRILRDFAKRTSAPDIGDREAATRPSFSNN